MKNSKILTNDKFTKVNRRQFLQENKEAHNMESTCTLVEI